MYKYTINHFDRRTHLPALTQLYWNVQIDLQMQVSWTFSLRKTFGYHINLFGVAKWFIQFSCMSAWNVSPSKQLYLIEQFTLVNKLWISFGLRKQTRVCRSLTDLSNRVFLLVNQTQGNNKSGL